MTVGRNHGVRTTPALFRATVEIPKIIHQTWKSEDLPASLARYQESWRRHNPGWEYRLWTDADNDALVRDEFPELLWLYRSLPRAIHCADFARVLYLQRFGGLYVDLDIQALRPADEILDGPSCVLGCEPTLHAERLHNADQIVCNAAMASVPEHPFWEKMLEEIGRRSRQGEKDRVWMTGPLCLQAAYEKHGLALGVRLWEPDVFFPLPDLGSPSLRLSTLERRLYERMMSTECYPRQSIGVHHWAHTWIRIPPMRGLFRWGARALEGVRAVAKGRTTADEIARPTRYGVSFPESRFPPRPSRRTEYETARAAGYDVARRSSLAIGVLIHNRIDLARLLEKRLEAIAELFRDARIYIISADSTDGTEEVMRQWQESAPARVVDVPPVKTAERGIARIAALRNALLEAIEADAPTDLVMMIDGDLEGPVSLDGIAHSLALMGASDRIAGVAAFGVNNYGVGLDNCFPFFGYTYYDPLAFRESRWERTRSDAAIRWRLGRVRRGDPLLEVKSGFAGMAMYRASGIRGLRYEEGDQECEHIGFHRALAERGGTLCINPAMLLLAGKQGHHEARGSS